MQKLSRDSVTMKNENVRATLFDSTAAMKIQFCYTCCYNQINIKIHRSGIKIVVSGKGFVCSLKIILLIRGQPHKINLIRTRRTDEDWIMHLFLFHLKKY